MKPIKEKKEYWKKLRQENATKIDNEIVKCIDIFRDDETFTSMIPQGTEEFDQTFSSAFDQYVTGDWEECNRLLNVCKELNPRDGPTKTLQHYMQMNNCRAPDDWEGYRKLTSK